jgi:hypothetical protein
MLKPVVLLSLFLVTSCSATKTPLMTEQEEKQFKEACVQGCEVVPTPIWNQIMRLLQSRQESRSKSPQNTF